MGLENTTADEPRAERLVEESRERRGRALLGRERLSRWTAAALFVAVASTLALTTETERSTGFALFAGLVVLSAIAPRIDFELGRGSAVPPRPLRGPMPVHV